MAVEIANAYIALYTKMPGVQNDIAESLGGSAVQKTVQKQGTNLGLALGDKLVAGMGKVTKAGATAVAGVIATGTGIALAKGFTRLKALDQAKAKLAGLGHTTETVDTIMSNALASVRGTALGMDEAATSAANAVAAGVKPGKDLERTLKLVADAATIAGTDMGSMGAIFNKVAASNKISANEINQLHMAGIPALQLIAEQMGITAEEASAMVSKGVIDFETFQQAIEQGMGGAALESGNTFSGAMDNVMASLGRVGAGILGGVFPLLAPLFQNLTGALAPLEDKAKTLGETLGNKLAPQIEKLSNFLQNNLGEIKVAPQIIGPATGAFLAFGASGLAPLLRMVPGLGGLGGALAKLGGPVGIATGAFVGMVAVSPELREALGGLMSSLGESATSLGEAFKPVVDALLPALVGVLGGLTTALSAVLDTAAGFLSWVSENEIATAILATTIGVLVGAYVAWKTVQGSIDFTKFIIKIGKATIAWGKKTAAMLASKAETLAIIGLYAKDLAVAFGKGTAKIAVATAKWVAHTAAQVGSKVALIASSVATGVATAAQWLFNVALSANPIGIIITAITALVGALIWFFTQTELGQQIWENVVNAISTAATWLWENVLKPVFDAIGAVFNWVWDNVIKPVVDFIVADIERWGKILNWLYDNVISPVFDAVGEAFDWVWGNVIKPVIDFITDAIKNVGDTVDNVFGGIADFIQSAFQTVLDVVRGPINALIDLINGVIDGLNSVEVDIPDWVPLVGGNTFGLSIPKIPRLAQGALIRASHGGSLVNVGEGRYDEVVQPLGGPQFDELAKSLARELGQGQTGSVRLDRASITELGREIARTLRVDDRTLVEV